MSGKKSFYITTTLPYVNAEPHLGHAMEFVHADIIARWKCLNGFDVFFNTGTDEHGQKVLSKAVETGEDPQAYTDKNAETFKNLLPLLGISKDVHFIRTTDAKHVSAAQEFWKRCDTAGDIYKKNYIIKYCTGCELEKTDSEIENGHCILHPHLELEIREEENYFFRFSKYAEKLKDLYKKENFLIPDFRLNEMRALIDRGLEDFSISRLKEKMSWGVSVPTDDKHVMYVWFDALVSYISTLGWPESDDFEKYWVEGTPVQFAGKDQIRQQAAMWQAMLISAGILNTHQIVIHGFLNISGQKMSKSLGNVLSPKELIDRFGLDAFRLMMTGINQFEDTDVSMSGFSLTYENNLPNGIGNLVARIMKLAEDNLENPVDITSVEMYQEVSDALDKYFIQAAHNVIFVGKIKRLDERIQREKPWETKNKEAITDYVRELARIALSLKCFVPNTSGKILEAIKKNKKPENLFPRKD